MCIKYFKPGVVVHVCNTSTQEAMAEGLKGSKTKQPTTLTTWKNDPAVMFLFFFCAGD
jgi:hypothetical protein